MLFLFIFIYFISILWNKIILFRRISILDFYLLIFIWKFIYRLIIIILQQKIIIRFIIFWIFNLFKLFLKVFFGWSFHLNIFFIFSFSCINLIIKIKIVRIFKINKTFWIFKSWRRRNRTIEWPQQYLRIRHLILITF